MAKVWFVRQDNRLIAVGGKPAYDRPFESIQWPLDIGVHRFYTDQAPRLMPTRQRKMYRLPTWCWSNFSVTT